MMANIFCESKRNQEKKEIPVYLWLKSDLEVTKIFKD